MQKYLQKWFGQDGRLDADEEAVKAVSVSAETKKRKDKESGATAIEYGLIAALIAVAIIGTMQTLGGNLKTTFNEVATNL